MINVVAKLRGTPGGQQPVRDILDIGETGLKVAAAGFADLLPQHRQQRAHRLLRLFMPLLGTQQQSEPVECVVVGRTEEMGLLKLLEGDQGGSKFVGWYGHGDPR